MRRAFSLALAITVAGCGTAQTEDNTVAETISPDPDGPFAYQGRVLRFPSGTVDGMTSDYPYARLKPQGIPGRFDYFVELGRPWNGKPDPASGAAMRIGSYSFDKASTRRALPERYVMWCQHIEKETASCAIELRSLPLAALLFPIGATPSDAAAIAAIKNSEDYLQKAARS
jgi:hypothetical protein